MSPEFVSESGLDARASLAIVIEGRTAYLLKMILYSRHSRKCVRRLYLPITIVPIYIQTQTEHKTKYNSSANTNGTCVHTQIKTITEVLVVLNYCDSLLPLQIKPFDLAGFTHKGVL